MTKPPLVDAGAVLGAFALSNSFALAMFNRTAGSVLVLALASSFGVGIAEASLIATVLLLGLCAAAVAGRGAD